MRVPLKNVVVWFIGAWAALFLIPKPAEAAFVEFAFFCDACGSSIENNGTVNLGVTVGGTADFTYLLLDFACGGNCAGSPATVQYAPIYTGTSLAGTYSASFTYCCDTFVTPVVNYSYCAAFPGEGLSVPEGCPFSPTAPWSVADSGTHSYSPVGVPGPAAGAGLPGLIFASGGLLARWRKRRAVAVVLAPSRFL